jgi:hypothetical protein
MRIALLISSLAFAACTVGNVDKANNMVTDAGGSGSGSGSGDFTACVDRLAPPGPAHTHIAGGTSNKGMNCLSSGCHLNNALGTDAPGFQFAGTVYAAGTTNPQAGAVVRIKSGTTVLTSYTDTDGNFSFPAGSLQGNFMATTNVSACPPPIASMVTQLVGGGGPGVNSCNLCHTPGGQAAPISL